MKDLTTSFLNAAPLPKPGKRLEYRDGNVTGLALRVTSTGAKSWVYLYSLNNQKRRLTLGPFPAITLARAREIARGHERTVAEGEDPILKSAKPPKMRPKLRVNFGPSAT